MAVDTGKHWVGKSLIVGVVAGIIVLFIEPFVLPFVPDLGGLITAGGGSEATPREAWVYHTWSYQQTGYARDWDYLYYSDNPVILVQFKVGLVSDEPKPVSISIPIHGKLMDVVIPPGVKSRIQSRSKNLAVLFESLQPGQIVTISFSIRWDFGAAPFEANAISAFNGKASPFGWGEFDTRLQIKQQGLLDWLFN